MAALAAGSTSGAQSLDTLPIELETPPQAERSRLLNADGSVLAFFYDENRVLETLDNIAPIMQQAQIAIEDNRFYDHGAIDLRGTLRAAVQNMQGVPQGGSGITQQVVRLIQVETAVANNDQKARKAATDPTLARKIREMRYAVAFEKKYTKDQILEMYLNIAYYGDGAYGVEAAARHYFNTSAAKLTLPQAAMLAGLVQNPVAYSPRTHPQVAIERRNTVLARMLELNIISADEAAAAKATTFDVSKIRDSKKGCANAEYPFICDYAERTLIYDTPSLGATSAERRDLLYRGGLTIQTKIDLKVQKKAEATIKKNIDATDPVIAVVAMMEPGTGQIIAMAQSRPKMGNNKKLGQTYWNYAVEKTRDGKPMGGTDGFSAGSTFKGFVAAAALENGFGKNTTFDAKSPLPLSGKTFKTCNGTETIRNWNPVNAGGRGYGRINMQQGTTKSVNNYYIQLELAVGMCDVVKMAKRLGVTQADGQDIMSYNDKPSFTLGTPTVPPLKLVAAYATFAAKGRHCDPVIVNSIKAANGNDFEPPSANCKDDVVDPGLAAAINTIFQGPYLGGTAVGAKIQGVPMAGKTGTLNDYRAIWTVGYTPKIAGAAMISYDPDPSFKKFWKTHRGYLHGIKLKKVYIAGSSGQDAGGRLLKPVFIEALKTRPAQPFDKTGADPFLKGDTVNVPNCAGRSVNACKAALEHAGFSWSTGQGFSDVPKGSVDSTSPSGSAGKGSDIRINISKGQKPQPVVPPPPTFPPPPTVPPIGPPHRP